jgi:uncharacterized protein YbjT (DUF2867 family)
MAAQKIIAIVGATGVQGGGLVRAILADTEGAFVVRALTRDPSSDKAKALASEGVEVVAGDVDDRASLTRAFKGAHGAFCVTPFWAYMSGDRELAQARNLAEAAKQAGVEHAIWSTLEDMRRWVPIDDPRMPTLQEKFTVPHFDAKGEANQFFTQLGVPTTFLQTSFYWENFIYFGQGPKKGPDGSLVLALPMGSAKLPGMAAADIGKCALAIFKRGNEFIGKTVSVAGDKLTGTQMAAALTKALGREVRYDAISPDVYRGFGFPGADEMGNMYQVKRDFEAEYCGARDLAAARRLNPEMLTFDQWLARYGEQIPLE